MNKFKILFPLLILLLIIIVFFGREPETVCIMDAKECPDGSYVSRIPPSCEFAPCPGEEQGILISLPKANEKIQSPLLIEGKAKGTWFFEAQFNAVLLDDYGNELGEAILTAESDWMTEELVDFKGELAFDGSLSSSGTLRFLSSNPTGLPEYQKVYEILVQFSEIENRQISLYYYDPQRDLDDFGNIKCSRSGLVEIQRSMPVSKTPIQDAINLLLKGKENLKEQEIEEGITTEYPLEGFSLAEVNLQQDGVLVLKFNDLLNKTSGGSCRVGILWFQIEATAKQFEAVKEVRFLPEELFQP